MLPFCTSLSVSGYSIPNKKRFRYSISAAKSQWGALAKLAKTSGKRGKNSYAAIYCAADGSRIGIMPRSSHVQPGRVGSEARVSMMAWALLVSMIARLGGGSCATADTRLWTWTPRAEGGAGTSRAEPTWGHCASAQRTTLSSICVGVVGVSSHRVRVSFDRKRSSCETSSMAQGVSTSAFSRHSIEGRSR